MRVTGVPFYPAHPTNYSTGRRVPVRKITIHHTAGWETTLRYLWGDPARNASSHFYVGLNGSEQYVDTDDTAWTNSNLASNNESVTIEVRGDWRNGYFSQVTLDHLQKLLIPLRKAYPNAIIEYHMDVIDKSRYPGGTLCPADLKHKGYARQVWDRVTRILFPAPAPVAPKITYRKITPKRVELTRSTSLWNFNFTSWDRAQSVAPFAKGHLIDVVAEATNAVGAKYYMTAYAYNGGAIRSTHGFNVNDCKDYVPVLTPPPAVKPTWIPMLTPRKLKAAVDLYVINLDTKTNQGDVIPKGKEIEFVEKINLDKMYLRSTWAALNKKNWGVPFDQLEEIDTAVVPREPIPEKPIDTDPATPGEGDIEARLSAVEAALKAIKEKLGL